MHTLPKLDRLGGAAYFKASDVRSLRALLRSKLSDGGAIVAVGVFDALSALLVQEAGYEVVYVSGGAVARSAGLPDLGLLGFNEVVDRVIQIVEAVDLAVIVDADTGYGNALNVARTVRVYERLGVSAVHIEDQVIPKRCGHYEGQEVIPAEEMVGKIRAAFEARADPNMLIIARTDARSALGLDEAIRRAQLYSSSGANMVFIEALRTESEVRVAASQVGAPLVYDMTYSGRSPMMSIPELARLGYRLILFPADHRLGAIRGMRRVLESLRSKGFTDEDIRKASLGVMPLCVYKIT